MCKEKIIALLFTVIGISSGFVSMALPQYLSSQYAPLSLPNWIWGTCVYGGSIITIILLLIAVVLAFCPAKINTLLYVAGLGGRGGKAKVIGRNSRAEGGAGGHGGIGVGGAGGDAEVVGDNSYARGGDGGNAAQDDGRGGRRTMSPGERLNLSTDTWQYGYGAAGANTPEYERRLVILIEIRTDYINAFPGDAIFINAGIDQVPTNWVNKRLEEKGEAWRVELESGGYEMHGL